MRLLIAVWVAAYAFLIGCPSVMPPAPPAPRPLRLPYVERA